MNSSFLLIVASAMRTLPPTSSEPRSSTHSVSSKGLAGSDRSCLIGKGVGLRQLWPLMTAEQIFHCYTYRENDEYRAELKELLENLLKIVARVSRWLMHGGGLLSANLENWPFCRVPVGGV